MATDIFSSFKNIKAWLWLFSQWLESTLSTFSVQLTTWWWFESSCGLSGAEGLCSLVGCIRFIHFLFIHHLSEIPIILSDPPFILSSGGVSVLVIIYYRHSHQLLLQWSLNIFIWWNFQLIFVPVHSITNLSAEIQVSSFHAITNYICVHHYHGFMLYFFIILCFHLAY